RHVHLWDAATGGRLGEPWRQKDIVQGIAFSPDGRTLAVSHYGDDTDSIATTVWDVATRQPRGPELDFHGFYFSPDGRLLASGWATSPVRLWDAATGQPPGPARPAGPGRRLHPRRPHVPHRGGRRRPPRLAGAAAAGRAGPGAGAAAAGGANRADGAAVRGRRRAEPGGLAAPPRPARGTGGVGRERVRRR